MADLPETMSGVRLIGHGGPEKLVWAEDIPVPRPGPGEALVRVLAAGVNNTDINTRIGWYSRSVTGATGEGEVGEEGGWAGALDFPRIQGGDLCGRVVALGEGVSGLEIGARVTCGNVLPEPTKENPVAYIVIGSEFDGAFAEYCAVPSRHLHDVTASPLSDLEIGAMPCNYGTAMGLITRAGVAAGDRVLVTGASGGVGLAAVQIARLKGAHVTGVAAASKHAAVREAGAEAVLDRGEPPEAGAFDAALDVVGGPAFGGVIDALRAGGRYAVSGAIAGPIVETDLRTVYLNDLTLCGSTYQPAEVFAELVGHINAGRLKPLVARTYPLREIHAAQAAFQEKAVAGKIVVIPGDTA